MYWIQALRLPFLIVTWMSVFLGAVLSWHFQHILKIDIFIITFIAVSAAHLGANVLNDYFDHLSGNDEANKAPTPLSGGSRVIQNGIFTATEIYRIGIFFFLITLFSGLYLLWKVPDINIIILGLFGILGGYFYTAPPLKFSYRGFGEILLGIMFGPLVVMGTYYVQTQQYNFNSFLASLPLGILVSMIILINEFPDYEADKKTKKNTLVVKAGKKRAMYLFNILIFTLYLIPIIGFLFKIFPQETLLPILSLPIGIWLLKHTFQNYNHSKILFSANKATLILHLIFSLLWNIGFLLA